MLLCLSLEVGVVKGGMGGGGVMSKSRVRGEKVMAEGEGHEAGSYKRGRSRTVVSK